MNYIIWNKLFWSLIHQIKWDHHLADFRIPVKKTASPGAVKSRLDNSKQKLQNVQSFLTKLRLKYFLNNLCHFKVTPLTKTCIYSESDLCAQSTKGLFVICAPTPSGSTMGWIDFFKQHYYFHAPIYTLCNSEMMLGFEIRVDKQ